MNDTPILPDDEPVSMPSMPTQHGGDPDALGRIDHYDLLRKLGGGGFGVVYLARDSASGVEVALKTLHPLLKRNAEEMDLLREKFALASRLAHPNLATALVLHPCRDVHVWDATARAELRLSSGDSVMVMRYAPGVTLSRWRRQFPGGIVPFDLALEVGRQVAAALDYAHSERIVHRDVKPGNIMVETLAGPQALGQEVETARSPNAPALRVRILDFGLAAEIRSSMSRVSTESGDTSGTRPYMAPEQWLGRKQDGRTDQYALACVLYELLSGEPPFAGVFETGDPAIMRPAVVGDAPEEIGNLSPAANAALLRALAKAPKDRFPNCATLVEALSSSTGQTKGMDGSTSHPPFGRVAGASPPEESNADGGARGSGEPPSAAAREAEALRRKVALARSIAAVSKEDRADEEFGPFVSATETELAVAEEAFRFGRIAAAVACLDRADAALAGLGQARERRAEAARKAREEAERQRREREEAARREAEASARRERERREEERRNRKPGEVLSVEVDDVAFDLRWIPENGTRPGFWMGETPVTQRLWRQVMGSNPSHFVGDGRCPVESVSWKDCQMFLKRLNVALKGASEALSFRLPTEEEWEFACRAGAKGDYCRLADGTEIAKASLGRVAWYDATSDGKTHPVGQKEPNAWGLYDMHGNVWEWTDTADGESRVIHGGGWNYTAWFCESSLRSRFSPSNRDCDLGFRLCASERAD